LRNGRLRQALGLGFALGLFGAPLTLGREHDLQPSI